MDHQSVCNLIEENMKKILSYSLSRLSDVNDAQDLAEDIICALLDSAGRLRDDGAFFPFMWRIAERKYADFLRKREKTKTSELTEGDMGENLPSAEEEFIRREDILRLRRELSLLSEQFRRATVMHYIDGLSCAETARKLNVSVEMVKYYLFRARKDIREGMNMERILGEKSYNPKDFMIDFWGDLAGEDSEYGAFRERKLKGNILLAAYYSPVTIGELSMELGCAAPYLEDEIAILKRRLYLTEKGGKYLTNIPIFTEECTREIAQKMKAAALQRAEEFIGCCGEDFRREFAARDENLTRWLEVTLCCYLAMELNSDYVDEKYGPLPADGAYSVVNGGGGRGIVWGKTEEMHNEIRGIYDDCRSNDGRGSITAYNFSQTLNAQHFRWYQDDSYIVDPLIATAVGAIGYIGEEWREKLHQMGYAVEDRANFAVFSHEEFEQIREILAEKTACLSELIREGIDIASRVCVDHAPSHIRREAAHVGARVNVFRAIEMFVNQLWESAWLGAVADTDKPCMFAVLSEGV